MSDFYGVVDGVYYCGMERTLELSQRMYERNVPSAPLQPAFSVRPVSSKYEMMPVYDRRAPATVPIHKEPTYNIGQTFNPGSAVAPWSGFATNVNVESSLRNQFFALQNCEQSTYVPSTESDMYKVHVKGQKASQPFPNLFKQQAFESKKYENDNVGTNVFSNHTRQQMKDGECVRNQL
jgi:hypothetical protein